LVDGDKKKEKKEKKVKSLAETRRLRRGWQACEEEGHDAAVYLLKSYIIERSKATSASR
jgi:hypothetical protein